MTLNKTLANILFGGVLLSVCIPFIVTNGMFFPFITGKGFVFRIGVEILFVLWLVLAIRDRSYLPKFSWIFGALITFLVVIGVADFFGVYPYKSFWSNFERMEGYITLIHLLLYFLLVSTVLNTQKRWNIFFTTSIGASLIMCFYGFLQLGGVITINQGGVRLDGTLGNAIYLAVYMLFNMFFVAHVWMRVGWSRGVRYAVFVPILILQIVILYYTATRGVILGLIGGVFLAALIIAIFERQHKSLRRHAIFGIVAVALVIGGFFLIRNTEFVAHSKTLSRFSSLSLSEIKTQGRYYIWPMAIRGFKEKPFLGWGQENFNYVFNKYYNPLMFNQEAWFDRTHNVFLDWLIVGGILGLGSYIALFVMLLYAVWRSSFEMKEKALLTGLIAAYVFQNVFAFDNLTSYLFFFAILAFVHGNRVAAKEPISIIERVTEKFRSGSVHDQHTFQGVAVAIIVIVFVPVFYVVNVKPLQANWSLLDAIDLSRSTTSQSINSFKEVFALNTFGTPEAREQLYVLLPQFQNEKVPPAVRAEFEKLGVAELIQQVERAPADTRYLLFLGAFLNRVRAFDEAIPYLQRAVETSPKKQAALFELAVSHINLKQYPEALALFKTAFEAAPMFEDARIFYGLGAIYAGDDALAREILKPVDQRTITFDDRVLNAYVMFNRWDRVIAITKERIAYEPQNPQGYFSLAAAYLKAGDRFSAIAQLQKAKQIEPKVTQQADFYIGEIQAGRNPQ